MQDPTIQMIKDLSDAFGASGFEDDVTKVARKYAEDFTSHIEEDSIRNIYLHKAENEGNK